MTALFIETPRFPVEISAWAKGGRAFKTNVIETYGGNEYREATWVFARGQWDVQEAFRTSNPSNAYAVQAFISFFNACMGQLYGFRFKDWKDYQADATTGFFQMIDSTHFQMYKKYAISPLEYDQIIQKPVSSTVTVTGGTGATVDYTTGIVTVSSGTPTAWAGEFDIPCRFADDMPMMGFDNSTGALYSWESLKLIEIRNFT